MAVLFWARTLFIDSANLLDKTNGKFDIVLANITADVLISLSSALGDYMEKDGTVIISGIIIKREEDVKNAFVDAGFKIQERVNMGEWIAFKLSR